jgi:hypothetical protein
MMDVAATKEREMPTLDLYDVTGPDPVRLDSVTLDDKGHLKYEGTKIKNMWSNRLKDFSADEVFHTYTGWSNGYAAMRLKKE